MAPLLHRGGELLRAIPLHSTRLKPCCAIAVPPCDDIDPAIDSLLSGATDPSLRIETRSVGSISRADGLVDSYARQG
jgi:hypothetical protein